MKKIYLIALAFISLTAVSSAQKYMTKTGEIDIYSETSLFVIEAKNQKVASILDGTNGDLVVSSLVRSFKFHEALVEEHFNENYMESHKFPKSVFKGKITNFSDVNLEKDGTYSIKIEGDLTMHGQTNPVKTDGKLVIKDGKVSGSTVFNISLASYKILVEEKYKDRISNEIKLSIHFDYAKM